MIIAIVCLCSMFHVLVQCYGQNVSPEVQGHLCLQACQVCHCYPENQRVILINSHKKKKKKIKKVFVETGGVYIRPRQLCQEVQGGRELQRGPWQRRKELRISQIKELLFTPDQKIFFEYLLTV